MYDEEFARARKRTPIEPGQRGRCGLCAAVEISTASEFEWPCLILEDWICETHCTEAQLPSYRDTRRRLAEQIGWAGGADELLGICKRCPYFEDWGSAASAPEEGGTP